MHDAWLKTNGNEWERIDDANASSGNTAERAESALSWWRYTRINHRLFPWCYSTVGLWRAVGFRKNIDGELAEAALDTAWLSSLNTLAITEFRSAIMRHFGISCCASSEKRSDRILRIDISPHRLSREPVWPCRLLLNRNAISPRQTLEVNDFRQHLLAAYGESPAASRSSDRYAAALFAVRLGLRDALVDWAIMYSIGYAVMAAFTYNDADPKR